MIYSTRQKATTAMENHLFALLPLSFVKHPGRARHSKSVMKTAEIRLPT